MRISLYQPLSFLQKGNREYQEDARFPDADSPENAKNFFIVCDGVGGSEHGDVASKTVANAFAEKMNKMNLDSPFSNDDFSDVLDYAYDRLDQIAKTVKGDMATTLTFLAFHADGAFMAHIGDSRIYHLRKDVGVVNKSDDHSLVNSMVRNGIISPEQGVDHPQDNVITRCMQPVYGNENRSQATVLCTNDVKKDDFFLLCSDGVYKCIKEDVLISLILDNNATDEQKMKKIAQLCMNSDDNNTAFFVHVWNVENDKTQLDNGEDKSLENASTRRFSRYRSQSFEIESNTPKKDKSQSLWNRFKNLFS